MIAAMQYARGNTTNSADILLFHLCQKFGCLPSELEQEDPILMEKFLLIDAVVNQYEASEMKRLAQH